MATRQPLPRAYHAAVGIGSKLVVWGGYGGSTLYHNQRINKREIEVFDVLSVSWKEAQFLHGSDMPDVLYDVAVTNDGGTAYCCGGASGDLSNRLTYCNSLFQIIPFQHLCQELKPASPTHAAPNKSSGSGLVKFGDKLVLYGGYTGQERINQLQVFDLKKSECELGCIIPGVWHISLEPRLGTAGRLVAHVRLLLI